MLIVVCIAVPASSIAYAQTAAAVVSPLTTTASRVEARFAKGMALAGANETAAAIEVFARLTQEYPRLPEPHVQLAALYVKQGEHRKALGTLRAALALRADDAQVQAALGDLYVTLAARAYRAAATASAAPKIQQKYRTLEQLERPTQTAVSESP